MRRFREVSNPERRIEDPMRYAKNRIQSDGKMTKKECDAFWAKVFEGVGCYDEVDKLPDVIGGSDEIDTLPDVAHIKH